MAEILSGKAFARSVRRGIREELEQSSDRPPGLTVIMVGDDPASAVYVGSKEKACGKVGIVSNVLHMDADTPEQVVLDEITRLNADPAVDGILCQLPVPDHISPSRVASAVDPDKDVDGFHPVNVGRLWRGEDGLFPCTPVGIMAMLDEYGIPVSGRHAVIVGRSNIVGKPLAALLLRNHATVTLCHSRTADLPGVCRQADILVSAVGRPRFLTRDYVKPGAVLVDVGITRTEDGLSGDFDFDDVEPVAGAITPVPGGVGPLTIAFLLANTLRSWKNRTG
jgi:methylenetetrahydrofolate dehydrogenase (NADP+)/methenyltetrahydrofolate cyclohydrolase